MIPERHGAFNRCNLYQLVQIPTIAHKGEGLIRFARILTGSDISGECNFMDFTTMPPGTTIGRHSHGAIEEEYYLILSGNGVMTLEDRSFDITAGDLIRNPPGGTHSLRNTGDCDLQLFVFELRVNA